MPESNDSLELPAWAQVGSARRDHIRRVTELLESWAVALDVSPEEAAAWRDAGRWHDALRDAPEDMLRAITGDSSGRTEMLHGPAAATMLARDGEVRLDLLDAIRFHTVGHPAWARVGRSLYMADFLEPGREFARADRAILAARVDQDFDGVFREVVRTRIQWALREGHAVFEQTIATWNALQ
ncbi:MAG TPA: HD domain-containing protein [Gemmatimonadaceae bacterium]